MGWLRNQIRKTPGEYLRAKIVDWIIDFTPHLIFFVWAAVVSVAVGIFQGVLALAEHDPVVAVLLGLGIAIACLAVLISLIFLVALIVWAVRWMIHLHRKKQEEQAATPILPKSLKTLFDSDFPNFGKKDKANSSQL
jgi:hypothetical protein